MHMLKHNWQYNNQRLKVCQNCQMRGHEVNRCNFLFFVPNQQEVIKLHNVSIAANRKQCYRNDAKRFNTRLNKNLISITAISYAISQKFHRESELTNDMMNRLQGSNQNFDDSLFNEDEKTSRYSLLERQITAKNQNDFNLQNMNTGQNTLGSNHTALQQ